MKKAWRYILSMVLCCMVLIMSACSSEPCENCGDTPTKGYRNDSTREKEYYCSDCSSRCDLCGDDADKHYTGGLGIVFICNDCYDALKDYGWID